MNKKIGILQSNYIPWKGYFDLINKVDVFVIYDEVQYTKNDWRNRNLIKTQNGLDWLTIPVYFKDSNQIIKDTKISFEKWNTKHWRSIQVNYAKAPFFKNYKDYFEELYMSNQSSYLSEVNFKFILSINELLGVTTKIIYSNDLNLNGDKNERLIDAVKKCEGTIYLSGPAAKSYLNVNLFQQNDIQVEWMDYSNYPIYHQLFSPFVHGVSILDLIFNLGYSDTLSYLNIKNNG